MTEELKDLFEEKASKEFTLKSELDYFTGQLCEAINCTNDVRNSFDFDEDNIDINIDDLKDRIESLEFQTRDIKRAIDRYEDARDDYNRASNIANGDYSHAADREV